MSDTKVFNIYTGQFEAPKANDPGAQFAVSMHEAIRDNKPLPSDRSAEELRQMEPGRGGLTEQIPDEQMMTGTNAPGADQLLVENKKTGKDK